MREPVRPKTVPNQVSPWKTTEEEREDREKMVEAHLAVLRTQFPALLTRFARVPDPRRPGSIRHKLTVILVYGILLFVFQMASRRMANQELSRPGLWEALNEAFPDLDSIPHADTLERLLERIEPGDLEDALIDRIRTLLRRQKLRALMVEKNYVIAFDGTQLWARTRPFAAQSLHFQHGETTRYSAYALKAMLVCPEGITLPIAAEFCENVVLPAGEMTEAVKQDCEFKAFQRLLPRLRQAFPRLRMLVVADGLYACGPVVTLCRRYGCDFMLVLKDHKLPKVWEEARSLHQLDPDGHEVERRWRGREQRFWWQNGVDYEFKDATGRRSLKLNVVVCEERWQEIDGTDASGEPTVVEKTSRHAWLSGRAIHTRNVHRRCNLAARHRWDIEEAIGAEKRVEHCNHAYSLHWQAIKGFYYLMLVGEFLNTLALHTVALFAWVTKRGISGTLRWIWDSYTGPWVHLTRLRAILARPPQLRLII